VRLILSFVVPYTTYEAAEGNEWFIPLILLYFLKECEDGILDRFTCLFLVCVDSGNFNMGINKTTTVFKKFEKTKEKL